MSRGRKRWMLQLKKKEEFTLPLTFSSIWVLNRLVMLTHIGKADLYSVYRIKMLIFSRNSFADAPRNNVLLALWAFLSSVKLAHKIYHHNALARKSLGVNKDHSRMMPWLRSRTWILEGLLVLQQLESHPNCTTQLTECMDSALL